MIALLFTVSILDLQPEESWALQHNAKQVSEVIQRLIEQNLEEVDLEVSQPVALPPYTATNRLYAATALWTTLPSVPYQAQSERSSNACHRWPSHWTFFRELDSLCASYGAGRRLLYGRVSRARAR